MAVERADIVIIGSGIGGSSFAYALAGLGLKVVILERGDFLPHTAQARDDRAIFCQGLYHSSEQWTGADGTKFSANNHYCVGGNSKFFGAVMYRYREEDFAPRSHREGSSPGWPMHYEELAPWYDQAEVLFQVRGKLGEDPTEPPHGQSYPYPPVPDEVAIAQIRQRLSSKELHPSSLPLAIDLERWLEGGKTGWDAFPNTGKGKIDAEVGPLAQALAMGDVQMMTLASVLRLETDKSGKKITHAVYEQNGQEKHIHADLFCVAAGAVQTSALLLRSHNACHPNGLANHSDQVGRNLMNHNSSAMLTINPGRVNQSIYQKTLGFNDFYHGDKDVDFPLGNVQLLGRVTGNILKAHFPGAIPRFIASLIAHYTVGWFLTSEDLPCADSRVTLRHGEIMIDWTKSNHHAHQMLIAKTRRVMKQIGFPIVLTHTFDRKTMSHQCGTAKMGKDAASSVVDPDCKAHDLDNLYITDASVLPTSAAVNPALTIAALALKAGYVVKETVLKR